MPEHFYFDPQRLADLAATHRSDYAAAQPFPHAVIDDFLPERVVDEVLAEFPTPEEIEWWRFESENERKLATGDEARMGDATRHLIAQFNSSAFIDYLQELTGIGRLVPDPHLFGGGLHQIVRGGHLNVHVDFNRHPITDLDRRLNLLLYLNRDWQDEYGGALELWNRDMSRSEARILPYFNRCVVFSTTAYSYHGHPEPLACPEDRTRKSLALYYYTKGRPEEGDAEQQAHNTLFQARPGDGAAPARHPRERLKSAVRQATPPALLNVARRARRRGRD